MASSDLSTEERLALLEQLERQEAARLHRAGRAAWMSVVLAAVVMAALLGAGSWRLSALRSETQKVTTTLTELREAKVKLEQELELGRAELDKTRSKLTAVSGALGSVDATQSRAAFDKEAARDPKAAQLVPRVYLQITNANDRAWAAEMGKTLQSAGFLVLGVDWVRDARPLQQTEVRFYKQADQAVAESIVAELRKTGVDTLPPIHLTRMEDNPKFRPNQFEVWFAPRTP